MILLIPQAPLQSGEALKEHGASKVAAYITHPVLSGKAIENIKSSQWMN